MERYVIHTCKNRFWYVRYYLVPSLKRQGIAKENIIVYNDKQGDGQLASLIKSYDYIGNEDAWHLQDDIIISSNFKEVTEKYDGIVCGFCNGFSHGNSGLVSLYNMWYSMPCIRIPGDVFKRFIAWLKEPATQRRLKHYYDENKHDDVLLEIFLKEHYPMSLVRNLSPNIVNHIDHFLGGSIINKSRQKEPEYLMATYWDEPKLLIDIEKKLKKGGHIA